MDDYESIESLQAQSKFVHPFDERPPSVDEIKNEIPLLVGSGLIRAYVYSKNDNLFHPSEFSTTANEEYWFLAAHRKG